MARRDRRPEKEKSERYRINDEITAREVRLIADEGDPVVISRDEALKRAVQLELDLVEMSSNQDPPVVKIIDYSKFIFEQAKKAKEAKKKQKVISVKEIKMRPTIDAHDFSHKVRHAREFIEKGDKVKFTVTFRGREMTHPELGFDVMNRVLSTLEECAQAEKPPVKEGRNITMIMTGRPGVRKI